LLRRQLGFTGLAVSDDLEMGALAGRDRDGAAAVEALAAGCDLLLYCSDLDRAEAAALALTRAASARGELAARLRDAAERVERTALRWPLPGGDLASWDRARAAFETFAGLA
jgi:beta-N-acetylhexosaminidase